MDAFISWVLEYSPVIGIIIVVGLLMLFLGLRISKYNHVCKVVESLPCTERKQSIDSFSSVANTVDSINDQVTAISKWIMYIDGDMIEILSRKCSPRVMTQIGRSLFEQSGAKNVVDDNAETLIAELEKKNPLTPYDVENNALDVLLANLSDPMFNEVKNYIYYQPEEIEFHDENGDSRKVRLSLMILVNLMGLELRDRYLAAHPEIK